MRIRDVTKKENEIQYHIYSNKGMISLIKLDSKYKIYDDDPWETYCLDGNLFEDIMRFSTRNKAEKQCKKFLD